MLRMLNPRFGYTVIWRYVLSGAIEWLRIISIALFVYALMRCAVFAYETISSTSVSESDELKLFSAYSAGFYSIAAIMLASYARTERLLGSDELA